ncbi:MAG TPA: aspartyl protease family protein, partial [Isosphaeraceae bacterium]|nr:aspartyl protease family protein [Isosphaeraceae bacterium]
MRRPRKLLLLGLLVAVGCAGSAWTLSARPAPRRAPDEAVVVPFEMLPSNHMVVRAKVNGKGPYRFIFDLGAPVTLLSNHAAEESGTIDKNAPKSFLMSTRGEGTIDKFEMGDLKADDVPVLVMDHPVLSALGSALGRKLEGIVGYTFWAHYRMTIDYQAKEMTFVPVDFEVRDLMKDLPTRLAGPKKAKTLVLAPHGLFGLSVGEPRGGLKSPGVPVSAVLNGSPAQEAGLKAGDVLVSLDGR